MPYNLINNDYSENIQKVVPDSAIGGNLDFDLG